MQAAFTRFIDFTSLGSARSERMPFFREMISEQTACKCQSAADARCTGCTPMMPLYVYILADLEVDFKRFFLLCHDFFFRYLAK